MDEEEICTRSGCHPMEGQVHTCTSWKNGHQASLARAASCCVEKNPKNQETQASFEPFSPGYKRRNSGEYSARETSNHHSLRTQISTDLELRDLRASSQKRRSDEISQGFSSKTDTGRDY